MTPRTDVGSFYISAPAVAAPPRVLFAPKAPEAARVTMFADADVTELGKLRQAKSAEWERRFGLKPSYSDLIHMAVARALGELKRLAPYLKVLGSYPAAN